MGWCLHDDEPPSELEYEFEYDDNGMPVLMSAHCIDCDEEAIQHLAEDEIRMIEEAELERLEAVHYNAEERLGVDM